MPTTRRLILEWLGGAALASGSSWPVLAQPAEPPPKAACRRPTPSQTEGPYFRRNAPLRTDIAPGLTGRRLIVHGFVLDRACRPVAGARIELWQADSAGAYDEAGDRLRGHGFSDEQGRWRFETARPGPYPGRTPHLHIKVLQPRGRTLTTQLYFPDEAANRRDSIFDRRLVMAMTASDGVQIGRYDLVL
jgi:protocatechuate 3,4-dioxygenase beta subunit